MLIYLSCQGTASEYPGVAKFGIALEWGSRGRWFESSHSDQTQESVAPAFSCFVKSSRFEPIKCRSPVDFCQTPARRCLLHSVLESSHSDQTQESVAPAFFCFVKSSRFEPIKCRSPVDFCQTPARRCLLHSVLESSHSDQTQESVAPAFSFFTESSQKSTNTICAGAEPERYTAAFSKKC